MRNEHVEQRGTNTYITTSTRSRKSTRWCLWNCLRDLRTKLSQMFLFRLKEISTLLVKMANFVVKGMKCENGRNFIIRNFGQRSLHNTLT